ncbi:hypothetical protein SASPL_156435 [Salvia splendens]|uniref:Uncharacterized protein n=1 Tax=Salvia splendens TaxID=180675 RepID=A0A8X8VWQ2_SALSN|nr:hypothetical protein SASPL_156435 [Salvia splendens]
MQQGSRIVPHSFSQKGCELKMAQYVIKDEVCFRAVEKPGFVALVNEFEPRFQMPNRNKVAVPMDVKTSESTDFIANVLDPRIKLQMLKVSVKKLKVGSLRNVDQVQHVQHLCDRFKDDLVSLWAEYKGVNDTVLNQTPLLECENVGDNSNNSDFHLFDELYDGVQEEIEQDQLNQISNEVDKYLADEMEKSLYKDPTDDDLEFYREIE